MAKDILDLLARVQKAVPDGFALSDQGAPKALLDQAAARLGPLPASWLKLVSAHDGGRLYGLDLWQVERVLAETSDGVVRFGMAVDDGEPLWWRRDRPIGDEYASGQGDPEEPTGGGAPGVEHLLAERLYTGFDDLDMPPKRALKALADHATALGGRLGGGGITFAPATEGAELPIQKLRGTKVPQADLADPLKRAIASILGVDRVQIASAESRIDHPLVSEKGRAELALWVETSGPVPLDKKASGAMVRLAQPVWKNGLEGRLLGDVAWVVVAGPKGARTKPVERAAAKIDVPGAKEAFANLLDRHLDGCGR